jgi:hypothetical protein
VGVGFGVADGADDDDGAPDGEALGVAVGEGANVGRGAFRPPLVAVDAPGVVMMNSVSPGKTKPRRRACSWSQAALFASPICC